MSSANVFFRRLWERERSSTKDFGKDFKHRVQELMKKAQKEMGFDIAYFDEFNALNEKYKVAITRHETLRSRKLK